MKQVIQWSISRSDIFDESLERGMRTFRDLPDRLAKFVALKGNDPMNPDNRYGKHDGPMAMTLNGFHSCHLRDDAILIYAIWGRTLFLVCITTHAEIEGNRKQRTATRLHAIKEQAMAMQE